MEQEKYQGFIKKFLLKKDNGWSMALFTDTNKNGMNIKIIGNISEMKVRINYDIFGTIEKNAKYGISFKVQSYKQLEMKDPKKIISFLSSSIFPGIGVKTASTIVDFLGENTLFSINSNPDSLYQVPDLDPLKAKMIIMKLKENSESDLRRVFLENELSISVYEEIYQLTQNEDEILELLKNDFHGWSRINKIGSFEKNDKIALYFGLDPLCKERIAYWAEYLCLKLHFNNGYTFTNLESLIKEINKLFNISHSDIVQGLLWAKKMELLYFHDQKIYSQESWEDEEIIVKSLEKLLKTPKLKIDEEQFNQAIGLSEKKMSQTLNVDNFQYSKQQKDAIKKVMNEPIVLITGGPGTGKSTLVSGIIHVYQEIFKINSIGIATPTGRAAARLKEILPKNNNPITIHKMLEANDKNSFAINENNPLTYDLIILDEMSMVDNHLFSQLMRGKGQLKKIVLVGDSEQLPPVDYGNIFEDLLTSKIFAKEKLEHIYRQGKENGIIQLAHNIQNDLIDDISWAQLNNVKTLFNEDLTNVLQTIEVDYGNNLDKIHKSPLFYQLIAPMYNGNLGIEQLNNFIQNKFNNNYQENKSINRIGRYNYTLNDKIMCLKNNTTLDLTNGEIGVIRKIKKNNNFIHVEAEFSNDKIIELDKNILLNDIALGYACSVHKTQGSEYERVVLVLDNTSNNFFLNKRIIYTAITRAKSELLIISDKQTLIKALKKQAPIRLSTIKSKLKLLKEFH